MEIEIKFSAWSVCVCACVRVLQELRGGEEFNTRTHHSDIFTSVTCHSDIYIRHVTVTYLHHSDITSQWNVTVTYLHHSDMSQ
jgi:hypothetical protein